MSKKQGQGQEQAQEQEQRELVEGPLPAGGTNTVDIDRIIAGDPIEIEEPYPFDDPDGPKTRWYIRQPDDWLYDMAAAVYQAKMAEIKNDPDVAAAENLPPSDAYQNQQLEAMENTKQQIEKLRERQKNGELTPEEEIDLRVLEDHLKRLIRPTEITRADEIAFTYASRARRRWMLQRLIVDQNGKLLFDPKSPEGQKRWESLGRPLRERLNDYLLYALTLIDIAKNSRAGQNSR